MNASASCASERWTWLRAGLLILLAAFALRLWHLNGESIWHDEGWSIRAIRDPIHAPDDNTPFLYYAAGHLLWRAGAGESPFAFRFTSVLLGTLTAAAGFSMARRWFGLTAALSAGALLALSPLLWDYAQEVRAYVAVPLFALLMLEAADRWLRHPGRSRARALALLLILQLAALYTHNLAVPLVGWLTVAVGLPLAARREWRRLALWAGAQTLVAVAYIPWLLTQTPSGTPLNTPPVVGLELARDIWRSLFLPALEQLRQTPPGLLDALGLVLVVAALGLALISIRRRSALGRRGWLLLSGLVLLPILTTLLLLAAHIDFHPRYCIAVAPFALLTLIAGTMTPLTGRARAIIPLAVTLIAGALSLQSILTSLTTPAYQHDDFEGLARYYATLPSSAAILMPFPGEPALQEYFAPRLGIRARFVTAPLYGDEVQAAALINRLVSEGTREVEFLTWYPLPADERGMYPCLLMAASAAVGQARSFYGLRTERYTLERPIEWTGLAAAPRYREAGLLDAAYAASRQGACVRTTWRVSPGGPDLRLGLSLAPEDGPVIARADADLARPDQVRSSGWSVDEAGEAYGLLRLPAGAPPAPYRLEWTLYSLQQPAGVDLLTPDGAPAGRIYALADSLRLRGPALEGVTVPRLLEGPSAALPTGIPFTLTLALPARADPAEVRLTLGGWSEARTLEPSDEPALAWPRFRIPPGEAGEASLTVAGVELARFPVSDPPRRFDALAVDIRIGARYAGVGTLVGARVNGQDVTLIWKAEGTPSVSYTVFVQLLGADGQVIAQSDSLPVGQTRPTTGWAAGEYIEDVHHLGIAPGQAGTRLIAGLYDAALSGLPRLRTDDGRDAVEILME